MVYEYLTENNIDLPFLLSNSHHQSCGAVVLFSGEVRNNNLDKAVQYLEFESFKPMATVLIKEILDVAKLNWKLEIAICQHRIGKVEISESAVCVITSSKHRKEAYEANQYIMERVKHEVPIWKKEYFLDGTYEWGNNCNCHPEGYKPENHAKTVPDSFKNLLK